VFLYSLFWRQEPEHAFRRGVLLASSGQLAAAAKFGNSFRLSVFSESSTHDIYRNVVLFFSTFQILIPWDLICKQKGPTSGHLQALEITGTPGPIRTGDLRIRRAVFLEFKSDVISTC
jgi:hypothetical protein